MRFRFRDVEKDLLTELSSYGDSTMDVFKASAETFGVASSRIRLTVLRRDKNNVQRYGV